MRFLRHLIFLALLIPQLAFAAYAIPLSGTTTSGTIFAFPTAVNGINPNLLSPIFVATSTSQPSLFPFASSTELTTTNLVVTSAASAGCATFAGNGQISSTGVACVGGVTATTTSQQWLDSNRTDPFTSNGAINTPWKSVTASLAGLTSGYSGYAFFTAPGTYLDVSPDTFPNVPFQWIGGEATYIPAAGVTFPNSFDIQDLTIAGNVLESDTGLTTIHQFENGVVSGNLTMKGLGTLTNQVVTGGSNLLIATSSLTNVAGSEIQNPVWNQGVLNLNDIEDATNTPLDLVDATTTSFLPNGQFGNVNILGATFINMTGDGLNLNNGATSTINNVAAATILVGGTHSLIVGNSKTQVCDDQFNNLTGQVVFPEASSSAAWVPCYDESLNVISNASTTLFSSTGPAWFGGSATSSFNTAGQLTLAGLGTPAGSFLAVNPSGTIIATTTPSSGGSGTVTSIATTWPISGGTITTSGTLSFLGLSTTSPWTNGNLAYVTSSNQITSVATSSLGVTGPITFSGTLGSQVGGANGSFGCATCNTSSLSGGGVAGMMTAWSSATNLFATSTDVISSVQATSTTATSSFAGPLFIGNATADTNLLSLVPNMNYPASVSTGGAFRLDNTNSTGLGALFYTNQSAPAGREVEVNCANATFTQTCFNLDMSGTGNALNVTGGKNALSFTSSSNGYALLGTYTGVQGYGAASFTSTATTTVLNTSGTTTTQGLVKFSHTGDGWQDANSAVLSLDAATSTDITVGSTTAQILFLNSTGSTTGNIITGRDNNVDRFDVSDFGVITNAQWGGQVIGATVGGTGQSAVTTGDLLYGSASNAWSRLGIGTGGFVLASVNGVPGWVATSSINNGVTSITGTANQIAASASTGAVTLSIPLPLIVSNASTTFLSNFNTAYFGGTSTTTISSTGTINTPSAAYDVFTNASTTNLQASSFFQAATSTFTNGIILNGFQPATSTTNVLDWGATGPQVEYRIGTAATTIELIDATTSTFWGSRKVVWVCNPNGTAGALTWVGNEWIGAAPTQTTTANQCDVYSFDVTRATSTSAYKIAGTQGAGFQ